MEWLVLFNMTTPLIDLERELYDARDAHKRQANNYIDLYNAVLGEGDTTSDVKDINAIAARHRESEAKLNICVAALQVVVNSCAHPDKAVRAVMVDLKPIRAALSRATLIQ